MKSAVLVTRTVVEPHWRAPGRWHIEEVYACIHKTGQQPLGLLAIGNLSSHFHEFIALRTSEFAGNSSSSKVTPGVACTELMRAFVC